MGDWKEETSADLEDATGRVRAIVGALVGEPSKEQLDSVWKAYLSLEKSIIFVRVETGEENPGRLIDIKQYKVPDERQALGFALRNLEKGSESFSLGDYRQSLKELREARNYLRALLREKRLQKMRDLKAKR